MSGKNMILEILEENDIAELYQPGGFTELVVEDLVDLERRSDSQKESLLPVLALADWVAALRAMEDVAEILSEESAVFQGRGSTLQLRTTLRLRIRGALKTPGSGAEMGQVFAPIKATLLKLLAQRLSLHRFLAAGGGAAASAGVQAQAAPPADDDLDFDSDLAQHAIS